KHGQQTTTREQPGGTWTTGAVEMFVENLSEPGVFGIGDVFNGDEIAMENIFGFSAENVGEAAGHARAEIEAERAENQNDAAGHIFAAVLAYAFDNGKSA